MASSLHSGLLVVIYEALRNTSGYPWYLQIFMLQFAVPSGCNCLPIGYVHVAVVLLGVVVKMALNKNVVQVGAIWGRNVTETPPRAAHLLAL